jgi:hypothetical protein
MLAKAKPFRIVASPQPRARRTAETIRQCLGAVRRPSPSSRSHPGPLTATAGTNGASGRRVAKPTSAFPGASRIGFGRSPTIHRLAADMTPMPIRYYRDRGFVVVTLPEKRNPCPNTSI